jgi:WD40 repeat protein
LLPKVTPAALAAAWSPAGEVIAVVHADHKVRMWDVVTGELRRTLDGEVAASFELGSDAWSCEGKFLATGSPEGVIRIWDADGKLKRELKGSEEDDQHLKRLVWSPDGSRLLVESAGRNSRTSVWEVGTGSRSLKLVGVPRGWSRNGRAIICEATSGEPGCDVVDADTGKLVRRLPATSTFPLPVACCGGASVAVVDANGVVHIYDVRSRRVTGHLIAGLNGDATSAVAIDADGNILLSGSQSRLEDAFVYVAELPNGRQETLTPAEFANRFQWTNQPDHVQLMSPAGDAGRPVKAGRKR